MGNQAARCVRVDLLHVFSLATIPCVCCCCRSDSDPQPQGGGLAAAIPVAAGAALLRNATLQQQQHSSSEGMGMRPTLPALWSSSPRHLGCPFGFAQALAVKIPHSWGPKRTLFQLISRQGCNDASCLPGDLHWTQAFWNWGWLPIHLWSGGEMRNTAKETPEKEYNSQCTGAPILESNYGGLFSNPSNYQRTIGIYQRRPHGPP